MAEQTQTAPAFQAPKKKNKWIRRILILAIVAALAGGIVFLFLRAGNGGTADTSYLAARAEVRDMTVTVTGPGTIKPNDTYRVTALVRGEVLSDPFEEGQEVKKDDVLYTIDAADVESAVKQARTGVEQARLAVESAQLNYDSLVRSRNDNVTDRQVKANADGVINTLYVDPGDMVTAGMPIADILDRDTMKLTVPFHAADAARFYVGEGAVVTVSGTAETLPGTVTEIAATDTVGLGGTLVRNVTIAVPNPGALSMTSTGSAVVDGAGTASVSTFQYGASKQLIAKYSGELTTLTVKEGDRVSDGQIIGAFKEAAGLQDQIDAAAIQLRNAQLSLRTAQDSLSRAEDSLDDYTIKSTIDGTVIEKNYKAGDNIDPSAASLSGNSPYLAVIYDMSRLTFDMNVDELDAPKLAVGQRVTITADALEGMSFTGRVDKININGTTISGKTTYPVTVLVDGDGTDLARQGLWPGMNVSANIVVEEAGAVLSIPVDAVSRGNEVLVTPAGTLDDRGNLVDSSKIETRTVELGRNDEDYIEVLSGLQEGDVVLIRNSSSNIMSMMMSMGG